MSNNPRLHVRISKTNLRKLRRISGDHGANIGALVDEAPTLLFAPPEKRPEAAIVQRACKARGPDGEAGNERRLPDRLTD